MTWFADMTTYSYSLTGASGGPLNVGWLAPHHEFPRGPIDESHIEMLWSLCRVTVVDTRGIHRCELCSRDTVPSTYLHRDERRRLGTGEIRAFSPSGMTFAAPDLVFHYVRDHGYLPPRAFLLALEATSRPDLNEYTSRLDTLALPWKLNPLLTEEPRSILASELE
jgi:hypothetical protein